MLEVLDAAAVRRFSRGAVASLEIHRGEIDRLNVFPVHDSDTGTNLATTLRAAALALEADPTEDPAEAWQVLARGAVLGASGNSGNIVAQLLRGVADAACEAGGCDAGMLRDGLRRGASQARAAVAEPVEGTILTVADAAADAAAGGEGSLAEVLGAALAAAGEALRRTTGQLAALARAGVVDAGARGLVLLLEALARAVTDAGPVAAPQPEPRLPAAPRPHRPVVVGSALEVQYLVDTPAGFGDPDAARLRAGLGLLGDSVVVAGTGEGTWSVHVHTDDAGAAIEAGLAVGRAHRISVTRLDEVPPPGPGAAVLAVGPGAGLEQLFAREGVVVVPGEQPSAGDLLAAVHRTGMAEVVLLTRGEPVTAVAEVAAGRAREHGVRVAVVPTRSPVQALAAVAVHDPGRRFDDDVVAMAEAAAATRFAEVTVAAHESLTSAGICQAGDVLGLIDGEVVEIGHGVLAVALTVVDRLLGVGAELITVLVGADALPGTGATLRRHVHERAPLTEVSVYQVTHPQPSVIIGAE